MTERTPITPCAETSQWVAGIPGLGAAVADWEAEMGEARSRLSDLAVAMARPGPVSATRTARHLTAAGISRAVRIGTRLPSDLRDLAPLRDPQAWARSTGVEAFVDQLALGGAATAELARQIVGAGRLFPGELVDELRGRPLGPAPVGRRVLEEIARRTFGDVVAVGDRPLTAVPVSQLHPARLADGRDIALRIRRPGVARELLADSRLFSSLISPLQQVLPQVGGLHPSGVLQLTTRQGLEAIDLRFEALNAVELGLMAEEFGVDGLTVARPIPDHADERVLGSELIFGIPLSSERARPDPSGTLAAVAALTLEAALVHGVFWADPAPEHLLCRDDGSVVLVGCGTVGHLSPQLRHAGILFLKSVLSGDHEGQVLAMERAGAMPPDAEPERLMADLAAAESLQVSRILSGGEAGLLTGLNEAVRLLLEHRLRPPLDVVLLLRTVFAIGALADRLVPEGGGLMAALFPLFGRLPDLIARAEAESADDSSVTDTA